MTSLARRDTIAMRETSPRGTTKMPKLLIVSDRAMAFRDRQEAGRLLSQELGELKGKRPVIVGIPRGGIVVAHELARELDGEVDIVLSRKLRTPGHEELAMGSVSEDGHLFINEAVVNELRINQALIERERAAQLAEIARRRELVRQVRPKVPLKGRLVVITDDGVATGATMQAALWAARQEQPERLICAVPVGSLETVRRLARYADETVCLRAPPFFVAVGQFYLRFDQVSDEDVLEILRGEQNRTGV